MTRRVARRVGVVAGAGLLVLAVAAFIGAREAGDVTGPSVEGDGISVSAPGPGGGGDSEVGASGGGTGVGPGPGSGGDGASAGSGEAPPGGSGPGGAPAEGATPTEGAAVMAIPDLRLTFGAMVAQAGGANPTFTYRAGVEARDAARYALAAELFDLVADDGGDLAPFAEFRAAQMVANAEGPAAAAGRYAGILAEGGSAERLPDSVRAIAITEGAGALEEAEREGEALAVLEQVESLPVGSYTRANALWERARILEASGQPGWEELAVQAMEAEPGSAGAQRALELLDSVFNPGFDAGSDPGSDPGSDSGEAPYPRLTAAYVAYRAFWNDEATARYEALLDEGVLDAAEAGQAWFYVGALRERAFDREGAVEAYGESLVASPDGDWADDARYWRGRVLEELSQPEEAVGEYDLLVEAFPGSEFVEDARLRAAVALGLADRGAESTERLAEITRTASPTAAAEASHWHDVLVALFDAPAAELAPATTYDPTSYAAALEQSGDDAVDAIPRDALQEMPAPVPDNRVPIDVWLASALEASREVESPILAEPEVELAWVLAEAGEPEVARGLLTAELLARRDQPYELVSLAYEAKDRALYDVAMQAATVILGQVPPAEQLEAPRELLALAYPVPFLEETTAAAAEFEVPPLLLYGLMRQESAFNPRAGSSAGAFGLTQVIFDTGASIASQLEMPGWTFEDLAQPKVATRFGAYYLAVQLDAFDGNVLAALSAYNGGPGNASRWLEGQPFEGATGYLYSVDFTETRAYLEHVIANYAMYRYVYAGTEMPRLPHGES